MGLTPPGGGDEGGRFGGGGDMHNLDTEHGRAIYCDEAGSGAVLGGEVRCVRRCIDGQMHGYQINGGSGMG